MLTNSVSVCDLYLGVSGLTRVAPGPVVAPQMTLGFGLNDPAVKGRLEGLKNFGSSMVAAVVSAGGEAEVGVSPSSLGFSTLMVTAGAEVDSLLTDDVLLMVKLKENECFKEMSILMEAKSEVKGYRN